MTHAWYLLLDVAFIAVGILIARLVLPKQTKSGSWPVLLALLAMTAVFDSFIVGFDIVAYDTSKILGVYIGRAPLEDFGYSVLAWLLIPRLWHYFNTILPASHGQIPPKIPTQQKVRL